MCSSCSVQEDSRSKPQLGVFHSTVGLAVERRTVGQGQDDARNVCGNVAGEEEHLGKYKSKQQRCLKKNDY